MKERFIPQAELTKGGKSTYPRSGGVFMAEQAVGQQQPQVKQEEKAAVAEAERILQAKKQEQKQEQKKKQSKGKLLTKVTEQEAKELRWQWYKSLTPEELENQDTRSTIEAAVAMGLVPQTVTSKGPLERTAHEVIANTLLSDEDRISKAEELLGMPPKSMSEQQANAILKAHYAGKSGVYRYTPEELDEKIHFLSEGGFDAKQRRLLIEAGIAALPITEAYAGRLEDIVNEYNDEVVRVGPGAKLGPRFIGSQLERVRGLIDAGAPDVDRAEARRLIARLNADLDAAAPVRRDGYWTQLKVQDFEMLDDPARIVEWVNGQYDTLYGAAQGKDATQSSYYEDMRHTFNEAVRYLRSRPKDMARLSDLFDTRLGLIAMNSAISSKNIENAQKTAGFITAHGLMAGYHLDNGRVGAMFGRMAELLEDTRLKADRGHVTPAMVTQLIQTSLIEEQFDLARTGVGDFASFYNEADGGAAARIEIERAMRAAYDMLIVSQRMHVIAARGKELFGSDAFFSDAGAAFKAFNIRTFSSEKWKLLTPTDERFMKEVVWESLVDEWQANHQKPVLTPAQRAELGDILFKIIANPPDFFSSGWRAKGMKDQLVAHFEYKGFMAEARKKHREDPARYKDPVMYTKQDWEDFRRDLAREPVGERTRASEIRRDAKKRAEDFALFLRLKTASSEGEKKVEEVRAEKLEKITQYKPEEIIRLLREKYTREEMHEVSRAVFGEGMTYDTFKQQYGARLRSIREQGFRGAFNGDAIPEQIDFGAIDTATLVVDTPNLLSAALIASMSGETDAEKIAQARRVVEIYKNMQRYINREGHEVAYKTAGEKLTTEGTVFNDNYRFADLYNKTLVADDELLGDLELANMQPFLDEHGASTGIIIADTQRAFGMLELSRKYSVEPGGDALLRNMNDLADGHVVAEELVGFLREIDEEKKFEHASTAALKTSGFDGREGEARVIFHTLVPFTEASMASGGKFLWLQWFKLLDSLGVEKLPLRLAMTKIERIYGHHAKPMLQDKRREWMDKFEARLEASVESEILAAEHEIEQIRQKIEKLDPAELDYAAEKRDLEHELTNAITKKEEKIKDAHEKGEKYKEAAEKRLRVRWHDLTKQKSMSILFFLILAVMGEAILSSPQMLSDK